MFVSLVFLLVAGAGSRSLDAQRMQRGVIDNACALTKHTDSSTDTSVAKRNPNKPTDQGMTQDLSGRIVGNQFRLERLLGRGGMGEVYLAEQLEVGRSVVIKLLLATQLRDLRVEERFKREARALAQLNHPNIVQLYTFGRSDDGTAYLAMEYIDGRTLASLIDELGGLPEPAVLHVLDQICSALAAAHQEGIVHRDLKPENVMLVERHDQPALVKVLDFGIAKLTRVAEARLTLNGEILGTPLYMAPEQLRDGTADERSDIFALGLIGYELLTGVVPFEADTPMERLARVLQDVPLPSLAASERHVSPATDALIARCIAADPAQRYPAASQLRDALLAIPREPNVPTDALRLAIAHVPEAVHEGRSRRRWRVPVLLASLLLMLITAAVTWLDAHKQAESPTSGAALALREWVQGIPFPVGTEYVRFEPLFIDARVPAEVQRVKTFYRVQLAAKWGGPRVLADGFVFESPLAPVEMLSVTPVPRGSRVVITRRPASTPQTPNTFRKHGVSDSSPHVE